MWPSEEANQSHWWSHLTIIPTLNPTSIKWRTDKWSFRRLDPNEMVHYGQLPVLEHLPGFWICSERSYHVVFRLQEEPGRRRVAVKSPTWHVNYRKRWRFIWWFLRTSARRMSCILFSSTRVTGSFRHVSAGICLQRNLHEEMPQIDHCYDDMQIYRAALLMTVGRRWACFHRWCECGVLGSITADDDNSDEPLKSNANLERSVERVLIRKEVM